MAYESMTSGWGKKALGFGLALLVAGVVKVATREGISYTQRHTTDYAAKFDEFAAAPGPASSFYLGLKREFPDDYARLREQFAQSARDGMPSEQIKENFFQYVRSFTASKKEALASAPHENLAEYRTAQVETIQALAASSTEQCAHFAQSGLAQSDEPDEAGKRALGHIADIQVRAMAAGERAPVSRPAEPPNADIMTWIAQMKKEGVTEAQLAALGSGKLATIGAADQCSVGTALLKAVAALPGEQADRISAYLIRNT